MALRGRCVDIEMNGDFYIVSFLKEIKIHIFVPYSSNREYFCGSQVIN